MPREVGTHFLAGKDIMPWERTPQVDSSWMSAPLERFTRLVIRFPVATLVLAGVAAAASVWLTTTQLGFRTSRAELLSPNSEYNRRWLAYTKEFGDKEDVVVVVEGESREQIVPALDDVCRELAARKDLFGAVLHQTDAPKLRSKGLYYLEMESPDPKELDLAKIDALLNKAGPLLQGDWSALSLGNMTHWMGSAINGGSEAQRRQILQAMQTELPRTIEGLKAAIGRAGPERSSAVATGSDVARAADPASPGDCGLRSSSTFPWPDMPPPKSLAAQSAATRLISDDGRTGFILLRFLEEDKQSFAQNDESIKALRQLTADVRSRHPQTKIGLTGLPIIEHDEMQSSEKSMSAATFLSFAGVLAVIIVAFGGFRHGVMAMTALLVGMVWACGCVALTVGHVNVLSIAFASILFGLGIDYGIYYVARYLQLRRDTESTSDALAATAASTGPGVLTGADFGHRLLRGGVHRVPRRGATRGDRRRRGSSLLACPNDRPARDDPAGRCRRRDEELARAAESPLLAAAVVRLSKVDVVGGRRLHGRHGGRRALSLVRLQSAQPSAGEAGERRFGAQAVQTDEP